MAFEVNQIGSFLFVSMSRPNVSNKRRLLYASAVGVDGHERWLEATRGELFQVDTFADTTTLAAAHALYRQYDTIVGNIDVNITWAGISDGQVAIHDVMLLGPPSPMIAGVGGLAFPSRGFLRCRWTLLGEAV